MEIEIILGTRAEFIKFFPVMLEFQKQKIPYHFISTGQHNLQNLCKIFGTKKPDVILSPEPTTSSKFNAKESKAIKWLIGMIFKIKKELKKSPDLKYVLFHGDTISTASASMGSSRLLNWSKKYKNVYLEAGFRNKKLFETFPEEIVRRISTIFSNVLIAPSEQTKLNLKKYKRKKVINLGNTNLDSVDYAIKIGEKKNLKPFDKRFALISIHRHENIRDKQRLKKIVEILLSLEISSYFTLHDNTKNQLIKFGLYHKLLENKNLKIIKPIDYVSMTFQLSKCALILADGGSMQEESLIFKIPCIILRNETERQGLEFNFQFLSMLDVEKTKEKIKEYLSEDFKIKDFENPYGKKGVSKKIVDILK